MSDQFIPSDLIEKINQIEKEIYSSTSYPGGRDGALNKLLLLNVETLHMVAGLNSKVAFLDEIVSGGPKGDPESFYREQLELICKDSRKTRARCLAESALMFWDEMVMEATLPDPTAPTTNRGCALNCGHTIQEHTAFDQGLREGEEGLPESKNPYSSYLLRESWFSGHSVGVINRRP